MVEAMFNDTARGFAEIIDAAIAQQTYTRGEMFVRAVKRAVPPVVGRPS